MHREHRGRDVRVCVESMQFRGTTEERGERSAGGRAAAKRGWGMAGPEGERKHAEADTALRLLAEDRNTATLFPFAVAPPNVSRIRAAAAAAAAAARRGKRGEGEEKRG